MSTITTAANEYARRPKDERFDSVDALIANAEHDRIYSAERSYNLKDLRVVSGGDSLKLASPKGQAGFTHWSFGQLCRTIGAPANYLRELPPSIAADAMNHGLQTSLVGQSAQLLVKANGGEPIVRAATSDRYGRLWDAQLYGAVADTVMRHDARWELPPVWGGGVAGAYRGDRDSFLIVTNGGSIVTDPTLLGDSGAMYRGILIRNSEVGSSAVTIETILYRYICGNHMLWGAMVDTRFRRRHIGSHVLRDTVREIAQIAYRWAEQSTDRDNAIIRTLVDNELAATREAVIDELRKIGATKEQAEAAYASCEQHETASPRSFWGAAQGLTRLSQDTAYQDDRYSLDKLAGLVMARGAKLVAA